MSYHLENVCLMVSYEWVWQSVVCSVGMQDTFKYSHVILLENRSVAIQGEKRQQNTNKLLPEGHKRIYDQ